jgi:hypothetical protein
MSGPIRRMSEPSSSFDGRLYRHLDALSAPPLVQRDASVVYAEGVHAGLSLAVAALQRRERLIDHLSRWEAELQRRRAREGA